MNTFVVFKTIVKGRKILGTEKIDTITNTNYQEGLQECANRGYGYMLNGKLIPAHRIEIRLA